MLGFFSGDGKNCLKMLINAAGVLVAAKHITKWVTGGGVRMYVHCPVHEGCTMYMVYEVYTYVFIFSFIILKLKI